MELQLLIGLILTIVPLVELRLGLPVVIDYCLKNNLAIAPYFIIVLILNVLIIFAIFFFLDFFHHFFMRISIYEKIFGKGIEGIQKKVEKIKSKESNSKFIALMLFVSVPLPGTGAWTGTLIAWLLGLNRLKSFIAIALGVLVAGVLILFASLGVLGFFY